MRTTEDVLNRLRAEYVEMPGLRLKAEQVQRLCGIERSICQLTLDTLVNERFLVQLNGHYARITAGRHLAAAKADLKGDGRDKKAS